ncbi:MAG: hypothetical protein AAF202_06880, partial [Pseudomonadota bacterium]
MKSQFCFAKWVLLWAAMYCGQLSFGTCLRTDFEVTVVSADQSFSTPFVDPEKSHQAIIVADETFTTVGSSGVAATQDLAIVGLMQT